METQALERLGWLNILLCLDKLLLRDTRSLAYGVEFEEQPNLR
jgi:hypothetical protein